MENANQIVHCCDLYTCYKCGHKWQQRRRGESGRIMMALCEGCWEALKPELDPGIVALLDELGKGES